MRVDHHQAKAPLSVAQRPAEAGRRGAKPAAGRAFGKSRRSFAIRRAGRPQTGQIHRAGHVCGGTCRRYGFNKDSNKPRFRVVSA
jgi:hypothetical protein